MFNSGFINVYETGGAYLFYFILSFDHQRYFFLEGSVQQLETLLKLLLCFI